MSEQKEDKGIKQNYKKCKDELRAAISAAYDKFRVDTGGVIVLELNINIIHHLSMYEIDEAFINEIEIVSDMDH